MVYVISGIVLLLAVTAFFQRCRLFKKKRIYNPYPDPKPYFDAVLANPPVSVKPAPKAQDRYEPIHAYRPKPVQAVTPPVENKLSRVRVGQEVA